MIALIRPPRHPRPAVARDPDDRPVDAGVQVAAEAVVGEEGVQLGRRAHPPGAYRKVPAYGSNTRSAA